SAACPRVQEASYGACPVHKPSGGPATTLSSDDGHSIASRRADPGHPLASPGICRVAVQLAQPRCPPPLPAGPGGVPGVYAEESLLLLALLRTLWRLSYQEVRDWLCAWPALARACGLPLGADGWPRVPSKAQQSKRLRAVGAPPSEMLFVLLV